MTTPTPHRPPTRKASGEQPARTGGGARAVGVHAVGAGRPAFRASTALRAGAAEAVGTFFLIYTGTATAAAGALGKSTAGSPPDSLAVALAFGLALVALVGALGQVSGAHLNGAVTIGLAAAGKFPWRYVPTYLLFQLLGAIAGAGATWLTFGSVARDKANLGATVPSTGVSDERAFIVEALITFLLVFVVTAVATDKRIPAALAAPSIGFALVAAVLIGGGITGGAVNPDRALGPAIMSGTYTSLWLYVVADVLGGVVAALLYVHVVGKATAPTIDSDDANRESDDGGTPNEVPAGNQSLKSATS